MKIEEQRVLVVGTGISGIAAAELLLKKGAEVTIFDGNKELDTAKLYEKSPVLREVPLILGELTEAEMDGFGVAVLSPGVPTDLPMVNAMRDKGIPIWGEIELAYYFGKGDVIAITGTNGKTTTTALTGAIMKSAYSDVKIVGNIGIPYTSVAADTTDETVTVAEISSFQLETTHAFAPKVSAILNITPDHLNRHHTMECYIKTKESIRRIPVSSITRMKSCAASRTNARRAWYFSAADAYWRRASIWRTTISTTHMTDRRRM